MLVSLGDDKALRARFLDEKHFEVFYHLAGQTSQSGHVSDQVLHLLLSLRKLGITDQLIVNARLKLDGLHFRTHSLSLVDPVFLVSLFLSEESIFVDRN